jgi:hypothetical protein
MPCLALPPWLGLPGLPNPLAIPLFPGLRLPELGLCCKIRIPPYPLAIPNVAEVIPIPAPIVTAYMAAQDELEALYDAVQIPCPNE